jgi:hypothetical protein
VPKLNVLMLCFTRKAFEDYWLVLPKKGKKGYVVSFSQRLWHSVANRRPGVVNAVEVVHAFGGGSSDSLAQLLEFKRWVLSPDIEALAAAQRPKRQQGRRRKSGDAPTGGHACTVTPNPDHRTLVHKS